MILNKISHFTSTELFSRQFIMKFKFGTCTGHIKLPTFLVFQINSKRFGRHFRRIFEVLQFIHQGVINKKRAHS